VADSERTPSTPPPPAPRDEVTALRQELGQLDGILRACVDVDPSHPERDMARLVLSQVEFLRQLVEGLAVQRMEAGTLSEDDVELAGITLKWLKGKVHQLAQEFGLEPGDLDMDARVRGRLL
jgi:Gas vesicle protein K